MDKLNKTDKTDKKNRTYPYKDKDGLIILNENHKIAEGVYGRTVYMTEEFRRSLPPMPQHIIDNSISLEDFEKTHPFPYDEFNKTHPFPDDDEKE